MRPWLCTLVLAAIVPAPAIVVGQPASRAVATITGTVVDTATGRPIPDAVIADAGGAVALTDADGRFALPHAGGGRAGVVVTAAGYVDRGLVIRAGARIALTPRSADEIIEVIDTAPAAAAPQAWAIDAAEVRAVPGAGNDVLKAAQALPGMARIPFGLGGLVVRGMSPRDTNVYLDGIEVPLAFHFFGITSFYPASQLASLEVQNGGFGVEHGRGQGGLVALTSRAPRSDGWQAGGEVSIVDASAHAEGPTGGLGAISVAVRRSYIDGILRAVLSEDDRFLPRYYDAQVRWDVGDARARGALTAWLFTSNDELLGDEARFGQSFVRLAARYLRQVDRTTVAITPWAGLDRLEFVGEGGDDEPDTELGRTSVPLGLRASITRDAGWGHVAAGLDLQGGRYGRLAIGTDDPMDGDAPMVTRPRDDRWAADTALWVEGRWRLDGERLAATAGLRLERYGLARQWVLDPRLLVSQRLSSRLTLRHTLGLYHQPPTAADTDPELGNPALDSAFALQGSTGLSWRGPLDLELGATAFASRGWHQATEVAAPSGSGFELNEQPGSGMGATMLELLEEQLGSFQYRDDVGGARSVGVELGLKRSTERSMVMASYTLTKARRADDPMRFTGWRPYQLDQLHNLSLVGAVRTGAWQLGARLRWVTGNPYTPTVGTHVTPEGEEIEEQGPPLSTRLPDFVQLDVRVDRTWRRRWGTVSAFLDVQNATWRDNVEDATWDATTQREEYTTGLPILPMFGVTYTPAP